MKVITFILLLFEPSFAHQPEEGKVLVAAGPYAFYSNVPSSFDPMEEKPHLGFALIAEADVDKNGGIELSMAYLNKPYFRKQGGNRIAEQSKRMYVAMGYRHWFCERVSAGLSIFTAYSMGGVRTLYSDIASGSELKTSAHEPSDDGLDFSFQYELVSKETRAILLDARYSYSFSSQTGEVPDHIGLIIAYKQQVDVK